MNRHIHVCWVCVEEDLRRVEQAESDLARVMAENMPVVGVITKARADHGFRAQVQELMRRPRTSSASAPCARCSTTPRPGADGPARAGRADDDAGPRGPAPRLRAAQKVDIDLKKRHSG